MVSSYFRDLSKLQEGVFKGFRWGFEGFRGKVFMINEIIVDIELCKPE